MIRILPHSFLIFALLMVGVPSQAEDIVELQWDELIPAGYDPNRLLEQFTKENKLDEMPDDDPKVVELQSKIKQLYEASPVNPKWNGKLVRLPGYVIPIETNGSNATEFLLVPYYGACIHVPPPPSNQTVYVKTQDKKGATIRRLFDTAYVTGVLKTETISSDVADSGYSILASKVEPYGQD